MTVNKKLEGGVLTLSPVGRLDTTTAPQLDEVLKENLPDAEKLIVDLSELEYMSSAGLRVMLSAHKSMSGKGGMVVKNVNEMISEVFEVTGFSDILNIE